MMSLRKYLGVLVFGFSMLSAGAFAHHEPVKELLEQAENLNQEVRYSNLNYQVRGSVYNFLNEVGRLDSCVAQYPPQVGAPPVSYNCQPQLRTVRAAFDAVTYYLYDASDVPNVYQAYLATRDAMYNVY
jgi:hypothetical protein